MSAEFEINSLLARYARGLDVRDFEMVAACFAADAVAEYGGQQLTGVDEIVRYVHAVERFQATTHVMTNVVVDVEGVSAQAHSQAVAYLVSSQAEPDFIRIRGIRYDDVLEKRDARWVIVRRLHRADWSATLGPAAIEVPPAR